MPYGVMRAILCLGRYGDIINSLPMAYKLWKDTGERPGFILSRDYADILDGVSYVEPVIFEKDFHHVGEAYDQFKSRFEHIHVAQVYCTPSKMDQDSFSRQMWVYAGFGEYFDSAELVFDLRDANRESILAQKYINGPTILVNFSGHSSPLQASEQLLAVLSHSWGLKVRIVNLAQIPRAYRMYDLLGLFDAASLLITIDTATLHLARASKIPSIQFITDSPLVWHGSVPCGNVKLSMRYGEIFKRLTEVHATIAKILL